MKKSILTFIIKASLFLLIANMIILIIIPYGTAEWFITIASGLLMLIVLIIAILLLKKKSKEDIEYD